MAAGKRPEEETAEDSFLYDFDFKRFQKSYLIFFIFIQIKYLILFFIDYINKNINDKSIIDNTIKKIC